MSDTALDLARVGFDFVHEGLREGGSRNGEAEQVAAREKLTSIPSDAAERIAELATALHEIDNWGINAPVEIDALAWVQWRAHGVLGSTQDRIDAGEIIIKAIEGGD